MRRVRVDVGAIEQAHKALFDWAHALLDIDPSANLTSVLSVLLANANDGDDLLPTLFCFGQDAAAVGRLGPSGGP